MPKAPRFDEESRGIRVPDATITPRDHGAAQAARSMSQIGEGMMSLGTVLGRQAAQKELTDANVEFERDLTRIRQEAAFMDVHEAAQFVDKEVQSSIDRLGGSMRYGLSQRAFLDKSRMRRETFHAEMAQQITTVTQNKMRVDTMKLYRQFLQAGDFKSAATVRAGAESTNLINPSVFEAEFQNMKRDTEIIAILRAGDDTEAVRKMRPDHPTARMYRERYLARKKIEDKTKNDSRNLREAYIAGQRVANERYIRKDYDIDALREELYGSYAAYPGLEDDQVDALVQKELVEFSEVAAYDLASKGHSLDEINARLADGAGVTALTPSVMQRIEKANKKEVDKALVGSQTWTASMLLSRLKNGQLAPQEINPQHVASALANQPDGLTPEQQARNMEIANAAYTSDISGGDAFFDLAEKGVITWQDAINLHLTKVGSVAKEDKFQKALSRASYLDEVAQTPGGAATYNLKNPEHVESIEAWYRHNILTHKKTGLVRTSFFELSPAERGDAQDKLDKTLAFRGVLPPSYVKDITNAIMNHPDHTVARDAANSVYKHLDPLNPEGRTTLSTGFTGQFTSEELRIIQDISRSTEKDDINEIRTRQVRRALTNDAWVRANVEGVANEFFQENVGEIGKMPHQAFIDFKELVRDNFDAQSAPRDAMHLALVQFNEIWGKNRYGQWVRHDVAAASKKNGMTEDMVYNRVAMNMAVARFGLNRSSRKELQRMMAKYFRHPSMLPQQALPRFGDLHKKLAAESSKVDGGGLPTLDGRGFANADTYDNWSMDDMRYSLAMAGIFAEQGAGKAPWANNFATHNRDMTQKIDRWLKFRTSPIMHRKNATGTHPDLTRASGIQRALKAIFVTEANNVSTVKVEAPLGSKRDAVKFKILYRSGAQFKTFEAVNEDGVLAPVDFNPKYNPMMDRKSDYTKEEEKYEHDSRLENLDIGFFQPRSFDPLMPQLAQEGVVNA